MATEAGLVAAITDNPDNVEAHLVYADWLQQHGDPRGELIVLQRRLAEAADRHEQARLGSLVDLHLHRHRHLDLPRLDAIGGTLDATWRLGFVRALALAAELEANAPPLRVYHEIMNVLRHPSVRLSRFELALKVPVSGESDVIGGVLDALPPALLALALASSTRYAGTQIASEPVLAPMCNRFAQLRRLRIATNHAHLGPLELPELLELELDFARLAPRDLDDLASARVPALRSLALVGLGLMFDHEQLDAITSAMPRLAGLELRGCPDAARFMRWLPRARFAAQLVHLSLPFAGIRDADLDALAAQSAALPRLRSLQLRGNQLTAAARPAIAALARLPIDAVTLDEQRPPAPEPTLPPPARPRGWLRRILRR